MFNIELGSPLFNIFSAAFYGAVMLEAILLIRQDIGKSIKWFSGFDVRLPVLNPQAVIV